MPKRLAIPIERRCMPDRKCKKPRTNEMAKQVKRNEGQNGMKSIKYDTNWNNMPNEMKAMIMNNMDLVTRTRLKMCSKADKCLVEAFPIFFSRFSVCYSRLSLTQSNFELNIERKYNTVKILKGRKKRVNKLESEREAVKMMEQFFYGILRAKNIRIEHASIKKKLNESFIPAGHMFRFESMEIEFLNREDCAKWLKHVAPGIKKIKAGVYCNAKEVGDIPCVLNAKDLSFFTTDINDKQILNLKATKLCIGYYSNVTIDGIKGLIRA